MDKCPCCSGRPLDECCGPVIRGERPAATAEELLRSRYSAYATGEIAYLLDSTHPDHRADQDEAGIRNWSRNSQWHGLDVLATTAGGPDDEEGQVEFIADYTHEGERRSHHELATFARVGGDWKLVRGEPVRQQPYVREEPKVGRNDPCPCGSGKKHKKCCGA